MFLLILLRSFFTPTLSYSGRSFHEMMIEKTEYAFLFSVVSEIRKKVSFKTPLIDQKNIILHFGRVVLVLDDLLETSSPLVREKLLAFVLGKSAFVMDDRRFAALSESLFILRPCISRLSTRNRRMFWKYVHMCYLGETEPVLAIGKQRATDLLQRSERKGGAFILSLVYLLNPGVIGRTIEKSIYYGGAWAQAIDDYFDSGEDNKRAIETVFSHSRNPHAILDSISPVYCDKIEALMGNSNFLIPMGNDIVWWVKKFRFLSPILHAKI